MLRPRGFAILVALVAQIAVAYPLIAPSQAQSVVQTTPPAAGRAASKVRVPLAPQGSPQVDSSSAGRTHWVLQVLHFMANLFQVPPGQPAFRDPFNTADPNHPWRSSTQ